MTSTMLEKQIRRHRRSRAKIFGTPERPRLSVKITLTHVIAQVIDDTAGKTLAAVTTVGAKDLGNMTQKATWAGEQIAARAKAKKVTKVVFDRGSRIYHGRLNALATAAREKGLEF
jgi:large subunit ribosomal protein L18